MHFVTKLYLLSNLLMFSSIGIAQDDNLDQLLRSSEEMSEAGEVSTKQSEAVRRPRNVLIEEIVVTAQKREENLQDVPISVSAFSGYVLEARGVEGPQDLATITPGMVYNELLGYSLIFIRGVGSDAFQPTADPSVATYIDGVYLPFSHGQAQNFVKLDRIEILKGPQGTLFGRNAVGGAINIVTRKPDENFTANLDATVGSENRKEVKAFVSGPILGNLYGSLSGIYNNVDAYYEMDSDSLVKDLTPDESKGLSARLQWDLAQDWTATVSALITRFEGASSVVNTAEDVKPLGQAAGVQNRGTRRASLDVAPLLEAESDLFYGQLIWTPEWFDMKLSVSDQDVSTLTKYDFDSSPRNLVAFEVPKQFAETTTAEFQMLSRDGGIFPDWLEVTSGLYYYDSDAGYADTRLVAAGPDSLAGLFPPGSSDAADAVQPVFDDFRDVLSDLGTQAGVPIPTNLVDLNLLGHVETEAQAIYLQNTFLLKDWFTMTLGGRYQKEERAVRDPTVSLNTDQGPIQLIAYEDDAFTRRSFSGKVSLNFMPNDNQLIYLSISNTEKSGTFNLPPVNTQPRLILPEEVISFELGNKGDFLDGTFRYSAAVYLNEIKNLQTQVVSLASGGAQNLFNAAEAQTRGVELDFTWQMFPVSFPGFVFLGSASYLDAEYISYPEGSGFDEDTGAFFGEGSQSGMPPRDFSGNTPVRAPEITLTIGPTLSLQAPGGSIDIGADVYYNSGFFFDTQNTSSQPKHILVNARLSYLYEDWNLRTSIFGRNLLSEDYYVNRFPTDFATNSNFANDRTFGLTLGLEY
jgi:iron complex outermembrane receptor protein